MLKRRKDFVAVLMSLVAAATYAMVAASAAEEDDRTIDLGQGWSEAVRQQFYFTPQGSRLVPYDWALALERHDSNEAFFSTAHIERIGYVPAPSSPLNPDALPIGFVKDSGAPGPNGPALGLTCAACHTGEIEHRGAKLRIDGGASLADFQTLMARLLASFNATLGDEAKFRRFADRLRAPDLAALRVSVETYAQWLSRRNANNATPVPYGHGRIDAFGAILNAVLGEAIGQPSNLRPPDAPVSVPFLWTTPAQRYVQWNGVATNPYGRNLGEVLGVFGELAVRPADPAPLRASALGRNLFALESWIATLKPPRWPAEAFGAPEPAAVGKGRALYIAYCGACHGGPDFRYTDASVNPQRRLIDVRMVSQRAVGTDPRMVDNFSGRLAETGVAAPLLKGVPVMNAGRMLASLVGGAAFQDFVDRGLTQQEIAVYSGLRFSPAAPGDRPRAEQGWDEPAYKAGPLAGVWATGPFLHNGSVPTVYDLLSPENERPTAFWVGSREFDPEKLGFVSGDAELPNAAADGLSRFDVALPGNSNRGHVYPPPFEARLSPQERLAIIAYLKTLEAPSDVR